MIRKTQPLPLDMLRQNLNCPTQTHIRPMPNFAERHVRPKQGSVSVSRERWRREWPEKKGVGVRPSRHAKNQVVRSAPRTGSPFSQQPSTICHNWIRSQQIPWTTQNSVFLHSLNSGMAVSQWWVLSLDWALNSWPDKGYSPRLVWVETEQRTGRLGTGKQIWTSPAFCFRNVHSCSGSRRKQCNPLFMGFIANIRSLFLIDYKPGMSRVFLCPE